MNKLIIALSCFLILPSVFAYDLSCNATRYMGLKKYKLSISKLNTSFGSRGGYLKLTDLQGRSITESKVIVVADYLEGDSLLTIESRDLDIYGYINMSLEEGDIEIDNKSYEIGSCERTR